MSVKSNIIDGTGTKSAVKVGKNNQIYSTPVEPDVPIVGTENRYRFYSNYLTNQSGVTNANINGSVTNDYFYIRSSNDYDLHIMKLIIYVQDGTVSHSGFGSLGVLINGINLYTIESGEQVNILSNIRTFAHMIEQTAIEKPFGDASTAFELDSVSGSEDAWCLPFTLSDYVPGGVRIGRGTLDKIELQIRDNLTGLTFFTVRALGYAHYPSENELEKDTSKVMR